MAIDHLTRYGGNTVRRCEDGWILNYTPEDDSEGEISEGEPVEAGI